MRAVFGAAAIVTGLLASWLFLGWQAMAVFAAIPAVILGPCEVRRLCAARRARGRERALRDKIRHPALQDMPPLHPDRPGAVTLSPADWRALEGIRAATWNAPVAEPSYRERRQP